MALLDDMQDLGIFIDKPPRFGGGVRNRCVHTNYYLSNFVVLLD